MQVACHKTQPGLSQNISEAAYSHYTLQLILVSTCQNTASCLKHMPYSVLGSNYLFTSKVSQLTIMMILVSSLTIHFPSGLRHTDCYEQSHQCTDPEISKIDECGKVSDTRNTQKSRKRALQCRASLGSCWRSAPQGRS